MVIIEEKIVNVLQVIQHFQLGGLERMVLDLLVKNTGKHRLYIVALEGDLTEILQQWPALKPFSNQLICLGKPEGISINTARALRTLIKQLQIDCVHSHHIGPLLYTAVASAKLTDTKHVTTLHDAWYLKNSRYRILTKLIEKFSKVTFVADAQAVADTAKQLAGIHVEQVVLNGIDTQKFNLGNRADARVLLGLPDDQFVIGCGARLEPGKGHETMIRELPNMHPNVCLAFAGDGSLNQPLKLLCKTLNIENRVFWLGRIEQMHSFYHALDCFCLFSENEGLPLAILEALSSGLPVVASNVGGIPEVVNGHNGMLIEKDDNSGLAQAFSSPKQFSRFQNIRDTALPVADVMRMVNQYENLYQAIV